MDANHSLTSQHVLPDDIILEIASFLMYNLDSLFNLQTTCKQMHAIVCSQEMWSVMFKTRFKNYTAPVENYRTEYIMLHQYLRPRTRNLTIVLLGKRYIGKQALLQRFKCGTFHEYFPESITTPVVRTIYGSSTNFDVYTCNSDANWVSVTAFEGACKCDGFLLCFQANDNNSMAMMEYLMQKITQAQKGKTIAAYLVVLKCDLQRDDSYLIEVEDFVHKHGLLGYFVTSTKEDLKCQLPFEKIFVHAHQNLESNIEYAKGTNTALSCKPRSVCLVS
jgi:hypothetical protein